MSIPDLDPQILAAMKKQADAGLPPLEQRTPEEARATFVETVHEQWGAVTDEVHSVEDRDADGVPVRIYRLVTPTTAPAG